MNEEKLTLKSRDPISGESPTSTSSDIQPVIGGTPSSQSRSPIGPKDGGSLTFSTGDGIGPAPDVGEGEVTPNQYANLTKSSKLNRFLNLIGGNVNPKSMPVFHQSKSALRAQLEGTYNEMGVLEPEYGEAPYMASGLGSDPVPGLEKKLPEHDSISPAPDTRDKTLQASKVIPVSELDTLFKEWGMGRNNLQGYEMTSQSRWGITIEPYQPKTKSGKRKSMLPDLPKYHTNSKYETSSGIVDAVVDLSKPAVLNWSLQYGNFGSEEMNLYGGRGLSVTSEFIPNMTLTMSVLDDYYMSWAKYIRRLAVMMTSANKTTPAHPTWWSLLWKISIRVFTPQYGVNLASELIASLNSAPMVNESSDDSNEYSHSLEFNIVGDLGISDTVKMNQSEGLNLKWHDVTVTQKAPKS